MAMVGPAVPPEPPPGFILLTGRDRRCGYDRNNGRDPKGEAEPRHLVKADAIIHVCQEWTSDGEPCTAITVEHDHGAVLLVTEALEDVSDAITKALDETCEIEEYRRTTIGPGRVR